MTWPMKIDERNVTQLVVGWRKEEKFSATQAATLRDAQEYRDQTQKVLPDTTVAHY